MAMKMKISGGNYVSDQRVEAFERALTEGPVIEASNNGQKNLPISQPVAQPTPTAPAVVESPPVVVDYGQLLGSLEKGLAMSFDHQEDTLRVHEQYLRNQADYAAIFSQLMEQQSTLFVQGAAAPSEALSTVLQTLSRSIEQFHAHQGDTLSVHGTFLNQQAEYSREFVSLLRQEYGGIIGQAPVTASVPALRTAVTPPAPVAVPAPKPVQAVAPAPLPAAVPAPAPVPVPTPAAVVTTPDPDSSAVDLQAVTRSLLDIVAEKTGYPADMLELDMDMEADLGIDSIKRVEILGALQDAFPALPEIDNDALAELRTLAQIIGYMENAVNSTSIPAAVVTPEPVVLPELEAIMDPQSPVSGDVDVAEIQSALLEIVSEKTGYPADMLELDMDMEADLGIDSIKRVEILGAMQDAFPSLPELSADALAELRTLGQITHALNTPVEVALKKV